MTLWRPPEFYIQEKSVSVPIRVASLLLRRTGLVDYHLKHRGHDAEVDSVVVAFKLADQQWRAFVGASEVREAAEVGSRSQWLDATAAADEAGVSSSAIRLACREQRLIAEHDGRHWRISRESLEHYKAGRKARQGWR